MAFGLGVLRMPPEQFWRMTPRELASAIDGVRGRNVPIDRARFDQLMKRYPDGIH